MQGIFHTYGQLRITNYPNTHVFASKTTCHSDVQLLSFVLALPLEHFKAICAFIIAERHVLYSSGLPYYFAHQRASHNFKAPLIFISAESDFFSQQKCQNLCLNHLMRHFQSSTSGLTEPWLVSGLFWSRSEGIILWGNCDSILQYL